MKIERIIEYALRTNRWMLRKSNNGESYDRFKKMFPVLNPGQYYVIYNANWFWYAE
jgi:hypothetical protein